jgi:uncharacterized protein YbaR (Trm112 family)/SAM-dependent methyltransferase
MRADLPALLPLVCPVCRHVSARGREIYTLSVELVLRSTGGEDEGSPEDIEEGILVCDNPLCGRRYPILHGIPIVLPDLTSFATNQLLALSCFDEPETLAVLAAAGPDDAALPRMLEYLSIYLDAHFGDYAVPPPDGPEPGCGGTMQWQAVEARKLVTVERTVELGCGVGRGLHALSQGAELTVGVEMNFAALLYAHWILRGETVRYARRSIGRHYSPASIHVPAVSSTSVQLICGDALDPPLAPESFQRVVSLNVLDSLQSAPQHLAVVDGLCVPGGEVLVASPFAWQSGVVAEEGRLGGADPAATLHELLTTGTGLSGSYAIGDCRELRWKLRRDSRSAVSYLTHLVRAHKNIITVPFHR